MPTASSALGRLLRDAVRLDRTQSDPLVALRNAIGVATPLAIGAAIGNAAFGLPSAIGALQTAFADRPGPYRLRMLRMSGTAVATAITSAAAIALSRNNIASAALVLVLGFAAGLLISAGPAATQVGVAATAVALIIGHQPQPPSVAVHVGLLVLAGGGGQVLLAIAAWPLGRHRPERDALAGLYRDLAALVREPPATSVGPPLGDRLATVRQTLYGLGHDHGPSVEAYRVLLDEAERIRGEVLVLAGQVEQLEHRDSRPGADAIRSVLAASSTTLDAIAAALEAGQPVDEAALAPIRATVAGALDALENGGPAGRSVAARIRALAGQLRAAVETARTGAGEGREPEREDVRGVARLRDPIAVLRANLNPDAAVLRHAVRAAVLVAGSDAVVRFADTPRGYWIPLTIMVTLRPDFATTFQRSTMRIVGTIVGLVLATVLVHFVPGGQSEGIALVALFFFGVRFSGPGNIGLLAICLAGLVVVLLSLAGQPPHSTVVPRAVDTLVGGAVALLGALAWPVWERKRVPDRLAALLDAYVAYLDRLTDRTTPPEQLRRLRSAARLARSNAQASVDQARADPVSSRGQVDLGEAVLAHTHRFVHALLTVDAVRDTAQLPEDLVAACRDLLTACRTAIVSGTAPKHAPRIRPVQERFAATSAEHDAALVEASDRIANSLDTLVAELRRQADELASVP